VPAGWYITTTTLAARINDHRRWVRFLLEGTAATRKDARCKCTGVATRASEVSMYNVAIDTRDIVACIEWRLAQSSLAGAVDTAVSIAVVPRWSEASLTEYTLIRRCIASPRGPGTR